MLNRHQNPYQNSEIHYDHQREIDEDLAANSEDSVRGQLER